MAFYEQIKVSIRYLRFVLLMSHLIAIGGSLALQCDFDLSPNHKVPSTALIRNLY